MNTSRLKIKSPLYVHLLTIPRIRYIPTTCINV
jgi:hypothetical protein